MSLERLSWEETPLTGAEMVGWLVKDIEVGDYGVIQHYGQLTAVGIGENDAIWAIWDYSKEKAIESYKWYPHESSKHNGGLMKCTDRIYDLRPIKKIF